ncbi:hypothetical protein GCM10007888_44250 [Methylobacterium oxalidis]|uniref:Uncharacterized protein n=1 Tax=Methylobacterium oxalidis TaxID=944322 RepID=A0ABQ6DPK6_9HYPH|nr:hypothetical protein GCM10007888_44250 [Methylobacterium oxalidis]
MLSYIRLDEKDYNLKKANERRNSDLQPCGSLSLVVVASAGQVAGRIGHVRKAHRSSSEESLHLELPCAQKRVSEVTRKLDRGQRDGLNQPMSNDRRRHAKASMAMMIGTPKAAGSSCFCPFASLGGFA